MGCILGLFYNYKSMLNCLNKLVFLYLFIVMIWYWNFDGLCYCFDLRYCLLFFFLNRFLYMFFGLLGMLEYVNRKLKFKMICVFI